MCGHHLTMTDQMIHTIDAPGATVAYDVRRNETTDQPPLMLIGSPMGAHGFDTLGSYLTDRTLVTYDPRGTDRSEKKPDAPTNTPEIHADDLHRVISEVGGPVDIFASSGGAISALALVAAHPNDVRILVAHEPPDFAVLPDQEAALAAVRDMYSTYELGGFGPAMVKFIMLTSHKGPIPDDWASSQQFPDPGAFGLPTGDDGTRADPLFSQTIPMTHYHPDYDALRAPPTRVVMAAGEESENQMTYRAAAVIAEQLGVPLEIFPGGHGGFAGNEYGQPGKPEAFAAKLREVLARP
jgi:pimeloyl-ACP methyl ester carboxylesterase